MALLFLRYFGLYAYLSTYFMDICIPIYKQTETTGGNARYTSSLGEKQCEKINANTHTQ